MSFIWTCLCILSLMWLSVVWQDVLTWLHNVSDFPEVIAHFLNMLFLHIQTHLPLFHDSILRKSWVSAPFHLGLQSTWPGNSWGPGCSSSTESSRCWVNFPPGSCTDVSVIPQPSILWLFIELLSHCELSHYLFLPDLLWTDFSQ